MLLKAGINHLNTWKLEFLDLYSNTVKNATVVQCKLIKLEPINVNITLYCLVHLSLFCAEEMALRNLHYQVVDYFHMVGFCSQSHGTTDTFNDTTRHYVYGN